MSTALRLRLFGSFEARVHGSPLPRLRTRRGQWLLALLVLRHGREVRRSWLAGTLWPDSSETHALRSLRQTLVDLRRGLGTEAFRLTSPRAGSLALDLEGVETDLVPFDTAITAGDRVTLQTAVSLYRGPLLEGWTEEWVLEERQAREQDYLKALERLAAESREAGDAASATHALRRVIATDPFRESSHRALMEALATNGEYAAAVAIYRDLRLLLHRHLNASPAPETTACYQTLREEARRKAGAVPAPEFRPRMPAPPTPGASAGTLDFSPTGADSLPVRAAAGLPRPLSRLLGRKQEAQQIRSALATNRLVTLTGAGGVGKTRLAIQVAHEIAAAEFGSAGSPSVVFVDLAPLADPDMAPLAVSGALGLAEAPGRAATETLLAALRDRSVLLALDNCEHVVDACSSLALRLLTSCPGLRILATSQQPLGLTGEVIWRVPCLSLPEPSRRPSPEALAQSAAVRLFVERAAAAQPGFTLSSANSEAVLEVCRRLDAIPLALELAAAWVRTLTVEQIAERLAEDFRLLTGQSAPFESVQGLSRQRTLRTAIEWSWALLTTEEQTFLARLSVFVGGWDLDAATQVCCDGGPEALTLLAQLIDKSLVLRSDEPGTAAVRGAARYRILETVRLFAREQLEEMGDAARFQDRHRGYFLSLAERAEEARDTTDRRLWLDRLETEHGNLRAAMRTGNGDLRLASTLCWFWSVRGYWTEGRSWLEGALASNPAAVPAERAPALMRAGLLAFRLADYRAARRLYREALAAHRASGDGVGIAATLYRLGEMAEVSGEHEAAAGLLQESLKEARACGARREEAQALAGLASVYDLRGDQAEALKLYRQSLALRSGPARRENIAALLKTANLLHRMGDPGALRLQEEALAISRELGDRGGVAFSLNCLGLSRFAEGDAAVAKALFEEALAIGRELHDERSVAFSLHYQGLVAQAGGEILEAAALLDEALNIRLALGDRRGVGASRKALECVGSHHRGAANRPEDRLQVGSLRTAV